MTSKSAVLARGLADALLAGPWERDQAVRRLREAVRARRTPAWATALVDELFEYYREPPWGRSRRLAEVIMASRAWRRPALRRATLVAYEPVTFAAPPRPAYLPDLAVVPETVGELGAWLGLPYGELAWFSDTRSLLVTRLGPLQHYRVSVIPKSHGGVRVLEVPKPRLKAIQRRLLRGLIGFVPPHHHVHGGVPGRSVRTALTPHAGHRVLIRLDLRTFFAGITAGRVFGVLATAGLSDAVAHCLTGLVTTTVPTAVWRGLPRPSAAGLEEHERLGRVLRRPHLPQGAPTSPALANLVAFALDRRLSALAASFGGVYTRYVDDLILSGDDLPVRVVVRAVADVVRDCGWSLNPAKTSVRRGGQRQQLLGAVVNVAPAVPRRERDRLRAMVHNCCRDGVRSQLGDADVEPFRAELAGRIAWVGGVNPAHGRALDAAFQEIDWSS